MDGSIRTDTITITPAILRLIAEIDEFKGAWMAIGRISPERLTALRRIATIESIGLSSKSMVDTTTATGRLVLFTTVKPVMAENLAHHTIKIV